MKKKKSGLGKGLDMLLANVNQADNSSDDSLQYFPLNILQSGQYQPRIDMAESSLTDLANSIKSQGIIQPIVVRPIDGERYEIITGERRWRAAKIAGLDTVPVLVRDVYDRNAMTMAIIENIQREDLSPMEEANALHSLHRAFSMTHQQIAETVGRSRSTISNLLRLRNLNEDVRRLVENGDLEIGHARALLTLEGRTQSDAAETVVEKALSVRETEQLVKRLLTSVKKQNQQPKVMLAELNKIETLLGNKLGRNVTVKQLAGGKGKLVISYSDMAELKKIVERFH